MIVTNVGADTVNGQTILTIDEIEETKTSLEIQLDDLASQISKFGYIGAAIIVVALIATNIVQYGGFAEYFGIGWIGVLKNVLTVAVTALTIIVAAVPEGLPLIINLITAQNAKIMIKHNVLAKHTNKIPEAGNIQLLCTDKTGTLTVGKLVPVENVMGNGNEVPKDSIIGNMFKLNIALNSSAMYDENKDIVGGNATERALLTMIDSDEYKTFTNAVEVTNRKIFNSANKFSAVETSGKDGKVTYYKGAPEKLIDAAVSYETVEGVQPIERDTLKDTIEEFKKAKDQQDEIRKAVKQELDELKEEKERTIYQMEADQQIIQLHEGMNASASSSESDHMLERVREGAKKTRERAAGAQIAYDTSAKAQDRRLEAQARNREADELLAEMKRKRGNN